MSVRLAVTGPRDHRPGSEEQDAFERLWERLEAAHLLVGDAAGVDLWARIWAAQNKLDHSIFYAHWETTRFFHGVTPRWIAGHQRNARTLIDGRADVLAAWPGKIGRGGTRDCTLRALHLDKSVYRWRSEKNEFWPLLELEPEIVWGAGLP